MKCYMQANKNDPSNFNILRDLSYLQLYLRQYESFLDTTRRGVELRPNLLLNWATYSFANYLVIIVIIYRPVIMIMPIR
jgi:hypothetical protein